ncbi:hypothetical protein M6B38_390755 [Iris pallida]|uniref:Uncharacterized protein n=1 Tax=Iris pallida TaxID=29817 RepID=A0AAX6G0H8_IRIPA|nr:hypothetical protein M6B38_390755 [Iris pallida]
MFFIVDTVIRFMIFLACSYSCSYQYLGVGKYTRYVTKPMLLFMIFSLGFASCTWVLSRTIT